MMKSKLMLFKMLIQTYPIMADKGMITKPFALVVENRSEALSLVRSVSRNPVIITSDSSKVEVQNALCYTNSDAILIFPQLAGGKTPRSVKFEENISKLLQASQQGIIVLLAFETSVPKSYIPSVTRIVIKDDNDLLLKQDMFPGNEDWSVAFTKYGEIQNKVKDYEWLYLSTAFLYPVLCRMGKESLYLDIVNTAHDWVHEMELFKDSNGLVSLFCEYISDYIENFAELFMLSGRVSLSEEELERKVCIKQHYLYLTQNQFEQALKEFCNEFTASNVKYLLRDANVLCPDSNKGFLSQMRYFDSSGNGHRPYRLRFDMQSITVDDGTLYDVISKLSLQKGGDAYEGLYDR